MISQLPNAITVLRLLLIAPLTYCIMTELWVAAFTFLVLAGLSDLVDGWLARKFGWISTFGKFADPLADKLTFGIVIVLLTWNHHYPLWLMLIVIGRDVVILVGATIYRLLFHALEIEPILVSKINTAVQVILMLLVMVSLSSLLDEINFEVFFSPYGYGFAATVAVVSGIAYVYLWSRRARADWVTQKSEIS